MALRSCLYFTTTKRYALCMQHLGHVRTLHTASAHKPIRQDLSGPISSAPLSQTYHRLNQYTPQQIVQLLPQVMQTYNSQALIEAAKHWDPTLVMALLRECGQNYQQLRYDLFHSVILARYTSTRNLGPVIECLPLKGKPTDVMPFYNAILVKSQKLKQHDHVRQLIQLMKQRRWAPDTATYNILIREQLDALSSDKAMAWLDQLVLKGMVPNRATFHIFIRHAIQHHQWDMVSVWLTRMTQAGFEPNMILLRILLKALVKHPQEPSLVAAFERATETKTENTKEDEEKLFNTAAAALLDSDDIEAAMAILGMAISRQSRSVYTYNLLLRGLCHQGNMHQALSLWKRMATEGDDSIPQPDIVTYTTLVHGLVRHHHPLEQIMDLYRHMLRQGLLPNNVLQSTLLQAIIKSNQSPSRVFNMFRLVLSHQHQLDESLELMQVYNMMMDYYFLYYHRSGQDRFPREILQLWEEAVNQKKLKPTVATLNILVRGLAILQKDVCAAEETVELFRARGVEVNERTVWFLAKAAYRQGNREKAVNWILDYEKHHSIHGKGLLYLKQQLMPS